VCKDERTDRSKKKEREKRGERRPAKARHRFARFGQGSHWCQDAAPIIGLPADRKEKKFSGEEESVRKTFSS